MRCTCLRYLLCFLISLFLLPTDPAWTQPVWTIRSWNVTDRTGGIEHDQTGALILGQISPTENIARGKPAFDQAGQAVRQVTDGRTQRVASWDSNTPQALNFFLKIDLGEKRIVNRVVIKPANNEEPKHIKGYAIQVSTDDIVYRDLLLNTDNRNPLVDTTFTPSVTRYVKVVVAAVDNLNNVIIGDIEVYGQGSLSSGVYTPAPITLGTQASKNFGKVRWVAETPEGTDLALQFRTGNTATPDNTWSGWSSELRGDGSGVLFDILEPRQYLQYSVTMTSNDPVLTPRLRELSIAFSDRPLARRAIAGLAVIDPDSLPNEVRTGTTKQFLYALDTEHDSRSLGFDQLILSTPNRIQIDSLTVSGLPVPYTAALSHREVSLSFDRPIAATSKLRVYFTTTLFDEENRFASQLLNTTDDPDNPQSVEIDATKPPVIFTTGFVERVVDLSTLAITPNPFSPNGDGINDVVSITYDIAKLNTERNVDLLITDISGRIIARFLTPRRSGTYVETWDGRDTAGEIVSPGIYLYRFHVDADVPVVTTGTIGVIY